MRTATLAAVLSCVLWGCEKPKPKPEPTYQGAPLSTWIGLTRDADAPTRGKAFEAINQIRSDTPEVRRAVVVGLQDGSPAVRRQAARAALACYGDKGPMTSLIREDIAAVKAFSPGGGRQAIELELDVEFMGHDVEPLVPEIQAVRSNLGEVDRSMLDESLARARKR